MKTENITSKPIDVETADGWILKASQFEAGALVPPTNTVILMLPAMGSHSRPARFMADFLTSKGHTVFTLDPRGHGQSLPHPRRGIDYGFDEFLKQDLPAVFADIKARFPGQPIFLIGHSLGAHLASIYAAENEGEVAGVVGLTAAHLDNKVLGRLSLLLFTSFLLVSKILGYLPGQHLGWGNPIAKGQVRDWAMWGITGRLRGSDGRALEPALRATKTPQLCVGFSDDPLAKPKSVAAFAAMFPANLVTHRSYTPAEVGVPQLGHMEHLRNGQQIWADIHDWITVTRRS